MDTTLAVAPLRYESNYKPERIFFKDRVRRKENDSDPEIEHENKKERARESDDCERKEYTSSQIVYIDDSVIMNGITFLINSDENTDVAENETDAFNAIADTERMLLEHYAQTFFHTRDARASTRLVFQQRRVPLNGAMALHVTGVWETDREFGVEYKWIGALPSSSSTVTRR